MIEVYTSGGSIPHDWGPGDSLMIELEKKIVNLRANQMTTDQGIVDALELICRILRLVWKGQLLDEASDLKSAASLLGA